MEQNISNVPVLITPQMVELKITVELTKEKISLSDLEKRALKVVRNEDNLKEMDGILKDCKKVKGIAKELHERVKKPYWDGGRACDAGKNLVFENVERIANMIAPDYKRLLDAIAERDRLAKLKKAQEEEIISGIESNFIVFSNKIIAAVSIKELTGIENFINLEKSHSRAKKYGEYLEKAIVRYDELRPVIRNQKEKLEKLEKLNAELLAAEAANHPDKMDEIHAKVDEISNEILQNNSVVQDAAMNQESFEVTVAEEVLPAFRNKRTNFTFEIADIELVFKKSRHLLEFQLQATFCRATLKELLKKDPKMFDGKDEVVVDGIKYIANRVREAL